MYEKFKYIYDTPAQLFDVMRSPATCYEEYVKGQLLDDCDGYHAALYHLLAKNGIKCLLGTYITKKIYDSHTILLMHAPHCEEWVAIDYTLVKRNFSSPEEALL